jgi:hypothetical protein
MKNNLNTAEFYSKAMNSMPFVFSSHKFLGKLRKTGIRKEEIKSDYHLSFLLNNSDRINKFLWKKKDPQIEIPLKVEENPAPAPAPARTELSDQEMINILKAKGYKVLKSTWNEL